MSGLALVRLVGNLGSSSDGRKVSSEKIQTPTLLREVIAAIEGKHNLILRRDSMLVLVNGVEANALDDLETIIQADDELVFIPMFHGGSN